MKMAIGLSEAEDLRPNAGRAMIEGVSKLPRSAPVRRVRKLPNAGAPEDAAQFHTSSRERSEKVRVLGRAAGVIEDQSNMEKFLKKGLIGGGELN